MFEIFTIMYWFRISLVIVPIRASKLVGITIGFLLGDDGKLSGKPRTGIVILFLAMSKCRASNLVRIVHKVTRVLLPGCPSSIIGERGLDLLSTSIDYFLLRPLLRMPSYSCEWYCGGGLRSSKIVKSAIVFSFSGNPCKPFFVETGARIVDLYIWPNDYWSFVDSIMAIPIDAIMLLI